MWARAAHAAAGCLALALAGWSAHAAHAEWAYQRGLDWTDRPAEDLPGRLEHYEEALRREPSGAAYALRSGQIRLSRAAAAPQGPERDAALAEALERLRRSVALQPLDARARASLAQALLGVGDEAGARRETRSALLLAPQNPALLAHGVRMELRGYRASRDPEFLRRAVSLALRGDELLLGGRGGELPAGESGAARVLAAGMGRISGADLLEAVGADPELSGYAASLLAHRPADASLLRAAARRADGG